jgi:surface carbohydrate biosynthesis protein
MHRPIFIPVETFNRELDSRLFLAARLAASRKRVFVGKHDALVRLFPRSKGGIFLGKSLVTPFFTDRLGSLTELHRAGGAFIHLDTEGAVFAGDEEDWKSTLSSRIDPTRLDPCDTICTWGEFQAHYYESKHPPPAIVPTGEPRFDLYKEAYRSYYESRVRELRSRFGSFILINTNLPKANNRLGPSYVFSEASGYRSEVEEARNRVVGLWERQTTLLIAFVKLIHRLSSALPDQNIVVRPHPSEDESFYRTALAGLDNVFVIHEGTVAAWLLAARAMIHDGCTTAVEAHFAECPIVNYQLPSAVAGAYLANSLGERAQSEEEVIELLTSLGRNGDKPVPELARRLLQNFEADSLDALSQTVASTEDRLGVEPACPSDETVQRIESRAFRKERAKRVVRPLSPHRMKHASYARSKFPGFKADEIEPRMNAIERITGSPLKLKIFSEDLLVIEADGP